MKELADILAEYDADKPAALATVVRVQGSSYRRPGARMLIQVDGHTTGGVSGGCLERDVIQRASAIMHGGSTVLIKYDTTQDTETGSGYSLGCGGAIDVLIEPLNCDPGRQLMDWLLQSRSRPLTVATLISKRHPHFPLGWRWLIEGDPSAAHSDEGIYFEKLEPPLELLIFGAGSDALPLVEFAKALGWSVKLVDLRSAAFDPSRTWNVDELIRCHVDDVTNHLATSPRTAAVVMTHNYLHDSKLVRWLATQPLGYLGLLGPRHRTQQVLGDLTVTGLHSPVGLDLGADNPQEVALAIVAEITAVLRGRSGKPLRAIDGPIHPDSPVVAIDSEGRQSVLCPIAAS